MKKKTAPKKAVKKLTALDVQVGGDHYKTLKIQPITYAHLNNLSMLQGSIVKYVTRFKAKGGKADLEKAKHCIDLLIGFEYPECPKK